MNKIAWLMSGMGMNGGQMLSKIFICHLHRYDSTGIA
jgi:hypothetical protein